MRPALAPADGGHHGTHHAAVDQVETQHAQAFIVATRLEPCVQHGVGKAGVFARHQVHHQKSDVVGGVDPAQVGAELQRIERHEAAILQQQVLQMQIAVALANRTAAGPGCECRCQRLCLLQGPGLDNGQPLLRFVVELCRVQMNEVVAGRLHHPLDLKSRVDVAARNQVVMEPRNRVCQFAHVGGAQLTALKAAVQPGRVGELAHPHRVLDRRLAAHSNPIGRLRDRNDAEVDFRRGAAVDAQLLLAIAAARRQRREIQESEGHRLLDLVGKIAGEQHP